MLRAIAVCAFVFAVAATVSAKTWEILPDGSGDAVTIQAGIDSAAVGDTVLVLPGSYNENLQMKGGIVLLGRDGCGSTTIAPEALGLPIIRCVDLAVGCEIRGFTLSDGEATSGAGIYCSNSSAEIVDNKFDRNSSVNGASIAIYGPGTVVVEGNLILEGNAQDWGGGIYCSNSSPLIEGNTISQCCATYGAAIGAVDGGEPVIVGNTISYNQCYKQGAGIHTNHWTNPTVEWNVISYNQASGYGGGLMCMRGVASVRYNVFVGNSADGGGGLNVGLGGNLSCVNNTFYSNYASVDGSSVRVGHEPIAAIRLENCILSNSENVAALKCFPGVGAIADCNDFWSNAGDYDGCAAGPNDFYLDPMFCDPGRLDFHIDCQSPCVGRHGCGLVGALGVGCGPTRTEPTTWGTIKALYR